MNVAGIAPTPHGNAVVLSDQARRIGVPIFVGDSEALAIMLRLRGQSFERPLTHDLLDSVLRRLGGRITSVRVDSLKDNVFHATIVLAHAGQRSELDARASDAIALAVGNGAPIYVAGEVIRRAGIEIEGLGIDRAPDPAADPLHEGGPPPLKL